MTETGHITDLVQLRRHVAGDQSPRWHLRMLQPELNGGRVSIAQVDAIEQSPWATALTISGLENRTLAHLVARFGSQFTAMHFWKCPRIADLSPLEDMPNLACVAFYWNQRATRLWHFARTPRLRALHFDDFTKLGNLGDLADATSLHTLVFGNAVWNKFAVDTLEPLSSLGGTLRHLAFNARAIGDGRIQPLARLTSLETLDFPSNLFSTEQLAWLRARLPATVSATALAPYRPLRQPLMRRGKAMDVLVCGKGKPFLSTVADASRLAGYVEAFRRTTARFAADATLEPG